MMTKQMIVLTDLERGKMTADEAVSLLKQVGSPQQQKREHSGKRRRTGPGKIIRRKGHWLGIHVREEDHNIRFYVPISLLNLGFFIGKRVVNSKYKDKDNGGGKTAREVLGSIKQRDMRDLVRAIREGGNTDLVTVREEDTLVRIRIV